MESQKITTGSVTEAVVQNTIKEWYIPLANPKSAIRPTCGVEEHAMVVQSSWFINRVRCMHHE